MKLRKNIKAFTLVELIVTIAVLGVLVLLAVPRLLSYTEQTQLTRIQHDTRIMENKMAEILNKDNNYNEWDDNEKDLGALILRNQLFEKEGLATRVDKSHLTKGVNLVQSDSELGVGGSLIDLGDDETTGYKIIPEEFKTAINTRLEGTFYSNENGKVYYEPNKPFPSIRQEQELACVPAEDLDYEFSVINGKGTITGYNGTLTHLYIPSAFLIDGKCIPVQVIGAGAFSNLGTLVRIYIPQSVERIEERAFEGNKLTQVEIPHSVNYIGENAFYNNNLSSETIVIKNESSNMTIVHGAFSGQPSGEVSPVYTPVTDKDLGIVFDRSTGKIVASTGNSVSISGSTSGSKADNTSVSRNSYESYVRIPRTIVVENVVHEVKEVAQGAYQGQGIIFVEFPDTLERIEDYAFAGNQLINVTIPSNVGHVGNYAFAYNEVNGERTMDFVEIEDQGRFEDDIDNLGNITSDGVKKDKIGNANLLDHIFITSFANFEIPEEYNPGVPTMFKLFVNGGSYLTTESTISFDYNYDGEVLNEEWSLNGEILNGKPQNKFPIGKYKVGLRITDKNEIMSHWTYITFVVNKYNEFQMNNPGSAQINDGYSLGDSLLFNYTNSNNLNWEVEKSGTYKIDVLGAGAGGRGARVQGEVELVKGQMMNFKIHQQSNGGGSGGAGVKDTFGFTGAKGGNGSGGTLIKLNAQLILAAGGAGGSGASYLVAYPGTGSGGRGGHGGSETACKGIKGTDSIGRTGPNGQYTNDIFGRGGDGGASCSVGGVGGKVSSSNQPLGLKGINGTTLYDGGGGGSAGGGNRYWVGGPGGGGAGGKSFINEDLIINPIVTPGHNSGHGRVIITYMGE